MDSNLTLIKNIKIKNIGTVFGQGTLFDVKDHETAVISHYTSFFRSRQVLVSLSTEDTIQTVTNNFTDVFHHIFWLNDSVLAKFKQYGNGILYKPGLTQFDSIPIPKISNYTLRNLGHGYARWIGKLLFSSSFDLSIQTPHIKRLFTYDYITKQTNRLHDDTIAKNDLNHFYKDIDVLDSSRIFTANIYDQCDVYDFNSTNNCTNDVEVNSFDSAGKLLWQRTVGGDAAYFGQAIVATPDSGCMVFVIRFNPNTNNLENDVYYIKFDKNGNQQQNYLPVGIKNVTRKILDDVILFPNPTSGSITFTYRTNAEILLSIYSMDSRLLQKSKSTFNKTIVVSGLATGIYSYKLIDNNGNTKSGLFERE